MASERIPIESLQTAVYGILNTALGALSTAIPVYSFMAPQDAAYPYAVISQFSFVPNNTKGSAAQDCVVTIEIYSGEMSATQINEATDTALQACTAAALSMAGNWTDIYGVGDQESVEAFAFYDGVQVALQSIIKYRWSVEDTA